MSAEEQEVRKVQDEKARTWGDKNYDCRRVFIFAVRMKRICRNVHQHAVQWQGYA